MKFLIQYELEVVDSALVKNKMEQVKGIITLLTSRGLPLEVKCRLNPTHLPHRNGKETDESDERKIIQWRLDELIMLDHRVGFLLCNFRLLCTWISYRKI